jgi:hypothetical protein
MPPLPRLVLQGIPRRCSIGGDLCSHMLNSPECLIAVWNSAILVDKVSPGIIGAEEGVAMNKHWLRGTLAAVGLTLMLCGPAWAQDTEPLNGPPPPEPPTGVEGMYVTAEDNEDNEGTHEADLDMGYLSPEWGNVCDYYDNAPIEFNILVDQAVCSGGELRLMAARFQSGLHEVYINGQFLGYVPPLGEEYWKEFLYEVPQSWLTSGRNLVEIQLVGDCGVIAWGALSVEPCAGEEDFVPEPGTLVLLGSGLAGLAGYATLRWRSKE